MQVQRYTDYFDQFIKLSDKKVLPSHPRLSGKQVFYDRNKVMSKQDLLLRFPLKICLVQSCYFMQHQLLYQSNRHFYTGLPAQSQLSSPCIAFLSLGNKHLFPSINFTSNMWVPTGMRWSNLFSLIKCRTLFLKVFCSHFSLGGAGAPNILLCQLYQLGNKAMLVMQTCSSSADLAFHVICVP